MHNNLLSENDLLLQKILTEENYKILTLKNKC